MTWEKSKLGEVCTIEKGNIGIMKAIPGEYPLVVLGKERKTHNEFQFDDEAVIIPLVSSTGHGHRSMNRIFFQTGKFSIGSILCAVIPKDKTQLSAEFLYRYLDFNKENELVARMKGMANVSLPMKEIADVEIPLPPLEVQKELIEEFQKLESGTNQISTELNHQLALIKELRQAFLREAMQGKLVPQDSTDEPAEILLEKIKAEKEKLAAEKRIRRDKPLPPIKPEEIPFEIPSNWDWCRLGEIVTMIYGSGLTKAQTIPNAEFPVFGSNGIVGYFNKFLTDKRAIIIGRKGSSGALRVSEKPSWTTDVAYYIEETESIDFAFLHFLLSNLNLDKLGKGIKPGLNRNEAYNLPIPLPPLAEQERIVAKLEKLMKFCDELEQNIKHGQGQTESLLQVSLKEALQS